MTSFMTVGCTDVIAAAAIDEIKDRIDDNDNEDDATDTPTDILTLTKTADGFSMTWDKKDTEYNEVMYRDTAYYSEAIMEGSSAILRTYQCVFDVDNGTNVEYLCTGLGTPELGDSEEGEVTLTFVKGTDYAFFVAGALIHNILNYNDDTLTIKYP